MTTYAEYQLQIAELQRQAAQQRDSEIGIAKEQIHAIMREHNLTLADLGPSTKVGGSKPRAPVPAKYRDDSTGEHWSGRGRVPKWLAGKNKDAYLIK